MTLRLALISLLVLGSSSASAQRYLTPIFESVDVIQDIQYGSALDYQGENQDLLLDFYAPSNDTVNSRPLVIYCHGGGFIDQNQHKGLVHIVAYCDSLARRGYTVASIDYRLDTTISNRAVVNAMHDAKAAVRFFKANAAVYGIDTALVMIGGESAGAVTALTTTYVNIPSEVAFPPTLPLADISSVEGQSGNPGFSSRTKAAMCLCGGTETVTEELLFDTTAINTGDQPLLIVHGTADPLIPVLRSIELAIRATNVEVPNLFFALEDATHCPWFFPLEDSWIYLDSLIDFSVPFLYACIQSTTGIEEYNDVSSRFILSPNPSSGVVMIMDSNKMNQIVEVEILDLNGSILQKEAAEFTNGQLSLTLTGLSRGLYFIRLKVEDITLGTLRFVFE